MRGSRSSKDEARKSLLVGWFAQLHNCNPRLQSQQHDDPLLWFTAIGFRRGPRLAKDVEEKVTISSFANHAVDCVR